MPKIQVNDIAMHYEIHGQGEPIVFIAGFSVDKNNWLNVLEYFKEKYQVILFDNRGVGQTDAPEGPYSIMQLAEDVVGLCHALNITSAHFVGSSMGGKILQTIAYHYPQLVKSAVLCNTSMSNQNTFGIYAQAQGELLAASAPLASVIKASCAWVFSWQFLSRPEMLDSMIQLGLQNPYPMTLQGYKAQLAALRAFDSREWVGKIKVPVLVTISDQDLIFSEKSMKALADKIPNAQHVFFENCGHLPQIEYPERFFTVVDEFIARVA